MKREGSKWEISIVKGRHDLINGDQRLNGPRLMRDPNLEDKSMPGFIESMTIYHE